MLVCLGDPYVLQDMNIMSQSLEGFSLPYMKEMAPIQDLDSYKGGKIKQLLLQKHCPLMIPRAR